MDGLRAFIHSLAASVDEARNQISTYFLGQVFVGVDKRDLHGRHNTTRRSNTFGGTNRNGSTHTVDDVFHRLFLQVLLVKPEVVDNAGQSGAAQNTLSH